MLVDSHCHLNFPQLMVKLDKIIAEAINNDVSYMQTICTQKSDYQDILNIIEQFPNVFGSVGIHPHHADTELWTKAELLDLSKHPKIIGLGETGLDYYYEKSDRINQRKSFIEHILASNECNLPIIVHTRSAEEDTAAILKEYMPITPFTGLLHCFTSSRWLAEKALDLGMYISISGICTFTKDSSLEDIIKFIPTDKLLIETDAPFLAPIPMRGKTNEPAFVKYVAEKIAAIKGVDYGYIAEITTNNFGLLFKKADLQPCTRSWI